MSDKPVALFQLRTVQPSDIPFLFNSWLKSYRDSPMVKSIPNTTYYNAHHTIIERLLKSPGAIAYIACNPEDPDQIYAYIVGEYWQDVATVIHWIYCKHPFRSNGIGSALIAKLLDRIVAPGHITYYSHRVKNTEKLLGERQYTFNPYFLNRCEHGIA